MDELIWKVQTSSRSVGLTGLGIMKGAFEKARVLYAAICNINHDENTQFLNYVSDLLKREYIVEGLLYRFLDIEAKWHATLINMKRSSSRYQSE